MTNKSQFNAEKTSKKQRRFSSSIADHPSGSRHARGTVTINQTQGMRWNRTRDLTTVPTMHQAWARLQLGYKDCWLAVMPLEKIPHGGLRKTRRDCFISLSLSKM